MSYSNIPDELKALKQWLIWKLVERDGAWTKIPITCQGKSASVNDPSTWCDFDCATNNAHIGNGIGFVFTKDDPYCGIDLDATDNPVELERQINIYNVFDSYSERSPSGLGAHIIIKANIGTGARRKPLELYSQQRFFTMTGDVIRASAINDYQELATILRDEIKKAGGIADSANALPADSIARDDDDTIIQRGIDAANGAKFQRLLNGDWRTDYQDKANASNTASSEADCAFMNMLYFYTQNHTQLKRIFLASGLCRDKYLNKHGDYYLNSLITVAADRALPMPDLSAMDWQTTPEAMETAPEVVSDPLEGASSDFRALEHLASRFKYDPPSGLVGDIAQFIYKQAPRPVPEIALAGALSLMAGICGQAYNVSNTGLNQYILVLAGTGTGKEAAASGVSKLMAEVTKSCPTASEFLGPSQIASSQALIKYMDDNHGSIVSIVGEFGLKLQQMTGKWANGSDIGLRSVMLQLYNRSGATDVYQPMIYSDPLKNTKVLYSPNFSMLGESTPERFYENLSEDMIYEGFLPRFTIIEYKGGRPNDNSERSGLVRPSSKLISDVASLCAGAKTTMHSKLPITVELDADAKALSRLFSQYCDWQMNGPKADEITKNLWNRSHVKALKLAALIAVGQNKISPVITVDCLQWAIGLAMNDATKLQNKWENGTINLSSLSSFEQAQLYDLCRVFALWCGRSFNDTYGGTEHMHQTRTMPHSVIFKQIVGRTAYKRDPKGAKEALRRAYDEAINHGILELVNGAVFATAAKCYQVKDWKTLVELARKSDGKNAKDLDGL